MDEKITTRAFSVLGSHDFYHSHVTLSRDHIRRFQTISDTFVQPITVCPRSRIGQYLLPKTAAVGGFLLGQVWLVFKP